MADRPRNFQPLSYNLDTNEAESRMFDIFKETNSPNRSKAENEQIYGMNNFEKPIEQKSSVDSLADLFLNKKDKEKETATPTTSIDFNKDEGASDPVDVAQASNFDAAGGGIAALKELPNIINNFSGGKPETRGEANSKMLNLGISGAKIGAAAGGPVGAVIGGFAGAVAGNISNEGWFDEQLAKQDKVVLEREAKAKKERMNEYVKGKTLDNLRLEAGAYSKALGYSGREFNS